MQIGTIMFDLCLAGRVWYEARRGWELVDADRRLPQAFGIRPEDAVLVRPGWLRRLACCARAEPAEVLAQISRCSDWRQARRSVSASSPYGAPRAGFRTPGG